MKKNVFYLLLAVLGFVVLPSCSKDKEEEDYALEIAKTYEGALRVADADYAASTIIIERTETNKVKLTLKDFTYEGLNLGDIVVDDITVKKGEKILLSTENKSVTVNLFGNPTTVFIDIAGTYTNGSLVLDITIKEAPVAGTIKADFTTDKSVIPPAPPIPPTPPVSATFDEIWNAIEGTYNGTVSMKGSVTPMGEDVKITIIKTSDSEISVHMDGITSPGMSLGDVNFTATVEKGENPVCAFSASTNLSLTMGAPMSLPATIVGKTNEVNKMNLIISTSMMGTPIEVIYSGSK